MIEFVKPVDEGTRLTTGKLPCRGDSGYVCVSCGAWICTHMYTRLNARYSIQLAHSRPIMIVWIACLPHVGEGWWWWTWKKRRLDPEDFVTG